MNKRSCQWPTIQFEQSVRKALNRMWHKVLFSEQERRGRHWVADKVIDSVISKDFFVTPRTIRGWRTGERPITEGRSWWILYHFARRAFYGYKRQRHDLLGPDFPDIEYVLKQCPSYRSHAER